MAKLPARSTTASSATTSRRAHWRTVLEECQRSGLSQAEFCRRRGIPSGTFAFWKHTLRPEMLAGPRRRSRVRRPAAAVPAFVPIRVIPAPPARPALLSTVAPSEPGEIEIVFATDHVVRVRGRVEVAWLAQLVRALAASC